ncbi:MAG: hypothetical protein H8E45_00905 [Proteobacteria bacterium]|nr:hypothetical protein [Pseudomonadota bacterium]
MKSIDDRRTPWQVVEEHLLHCDECSTGQQDLSALARILNDSPGPPLDAELLRDRCLAALTPRLEHLSTPARYKRLLAALSPALLPLPLSLAWAAWLLVQLHGVVSAWLPGEVATLLVAGQAAAVSLLFAATYAALPLLLEQSGPGSTILNSRGERSIP